MVRLTEDIFSGYGTKLMDLFYAGWTIPCKCIPAWSVFSCTVDVVVPLLPITCSTKDRTTGSTLLHESNKFQAGYKGACFPWQSGGTGEEETLPIHLNPLDHKWYPDASSLQLHVNIAIFYNTYKYCLTSGRGSLSITSSILSGDQNFMEFYGLEMMLEIARFWASRTTFNETTGRYEILGVMGPDEFHGLKGVIAVNNSIQKSIQEQKNTAWITTGKMTAFCWHSQLHQHYGCLAFG